MPNAHSIPIDRMVQIIEIFQRFGYRSPSMLDIASQLAISKKTLYSYALNKEELIQKSISAIKEDFESRIIAMRGNATDEKTDFDNWFLLLVDFHQEFSSYACQDLSNFYPNAELDYLAFRKHILDCFVQDLKVKKASKSLFIVKTIDRHIESIVHEELQIEGKSYSHLIQEALEYNWKAVLNF